MTHATFLLPAPAHFGAQRLDGVAAKALGRATRTPALPDGSDAQLARHIQLTPQGWPLAALSRQHDAGDAADACWLRADPAFVRPDINGARLLACGEGLGVTGEDAQALLPALRPLFGDAGCPLDAPTPTRWYLRLAPGVRLPSFVTPDDALGADLFEHLAHGADARRWRALSNEAQVVLHNHPWNRERAARGLAPINSLWFWGGGRLPDRVSTAHAAVFTHAQVLSILAQASGAPLAPLPATFDGKAGLFDLRHLRDLRAFSAHWLAPALAALASGALSSLTLDLDGGRGYRLSGAQRWRLWRRAQRALTP